MYVAERQPFKFGRVYGYCVAGIFLFHVFINVGMVLGLTPVIGIPLPFLVMEALLYGDSHCFYLYSCVLMQEET